MSTNLWQIVPFKKFKTKCESSFGENFPERIFLYSLMAMILIYAMMCSSFNSSGNIFDIIDKLRYVAAFMMLIKIYFLSDYNIKQLSLLSLLYIFTFFNSIKAYDPTLFFSAIMIFGSKDVEYKKICKYVFFTMLLSACSIFTLHIFGVLNDFLVPRGDTFRHSFGFSHPNTTGLWILCIIASCQQAFCEKLKLCHYALFAIIALIMNISVNSRAALVSILLISIIMPILTKVKFSEKKCKYIAVGIVVLIYIAVIVFTLYYNENNSFMLMLDKLFSYRISLSHSAYEYYNVTLFGSSLPVTDAKFVLDCMIVRILLTYGVLTLILSGICLCKIQVRAINNKCIYIAAMSLILLIYSIMETFPYNAVFNVTLLMVCAKLGE